MNSYRLIFAGALSLSLIEGARAQSVTFSQMSYDLDGYVSMDTDYGRCALTYAASTSMQYFNLQVDGVWQIQNMAVFGQDASNAVNFYFGIGSNGTRVDNVSYDFSLTSTPTGMPIGSFLAGVSHEETSLSSGHIGETMAGPLVPGASSQTDGAGASPDMDHAGYINQPCGKNECTPTAVSNSLLWLNQKYSLGIPPSELSIKNMKTATNWGITGCNTNPDDADAWWKRKDKYIKAKGWGITTTDLGTDLGKIVDGYRDNQDIELDVLGHTIELVGLKVLPHNRFQMTLAGDDSQIMNPSTCSIDNVILNGNTLNFIDGPGWIKGRRLVRAIMECPTSVPEPATLASVALGAVLALRRKSHSRTERPRLNGR